MPVIERGDAITREQWDTDARIYRRWEGEPLIIERPFTDAENANADRAVADDTRRSNRAELLRRSREALISNAAYLEAVAAGKATNAQHIAQTAALTRQMQAVIRLLGRSDLLDTTGA